MIPLAALSGLTRGTAWCGWDELCEAELPLPDNWSVGFYKKAAPFPSFDAVSPKQSQNQTFISTQSSSELLDAVCMSSVLSCCSGSPWASSLAVLAQRWIPGLAPEAAGNVVPVAVERAVEQHTWQRWAVLQLSGQHCSGGLCQQQNLPGGSRASTWGGRRLLGSPSAGAALSPLQQCLCSLIAGVLLLTSPFTVWHIPLKCYKIQYFHQEAMKETALSLDFETTWIIFIASR